MKTKSPNVSARIPALGVPVAGKLGNGPVEVLVIGGMIGEDEVVHEFDALVHPPLLHTKLQDPVSPKMHDVFGAETVDPEDAAGMRQLAMTMLEQFDDPPMGGGGGGDAQTPPVSIPVSS